MHARGVVRLRAAILVLSVLAFVAGCASRPHPSTQPAAGPLTTDVRTFVPSGSHVARTADGSCWTGSITVRDEHAYRCFAGNDILDPCFATSVAGGALCYATPWSQPVRLHLTGVLPAASDLRIAHPWALQLRDGTRCVATTGVANRVGTTVLVYRCGDQGAAGLPVRRSGALSVAYTRTGAAPLHRAAVAVTWLA